MGSREKRQDLITNYLQIEDEGEKRVEDDSKGSLSDGLENSSTTEKNEGSSVRITETGGDSSGIKAGIKKKKKRGERN